MFKWCLFATVIMLILNLVGVIGIPWIAVFAPLLAWFAIFVVIFGGFSLIVGFIAIIGIIKSKL